MQKILVFCTVLAIILIGCSQNPSDEAIQTAIAKTAEIDPTQTESRPTDTSTPAPTVTPTLDIRVINIDPNQFLLTKDMLPRDGKYYLPASDWISPLRNHEIVSGWGVEEGKAYLAETGRVDGWEVYYLRGSSSFLGPEQIYENVVLYKSAQGALLVMTKYSTCTDPNSGYSSQTIDFQIGDKTNVCIVYEMQPSGENRMWYRLEFSYRNYYHSLNLWGWEYEIDPDLAEEIARSLFSVLESADLSNEVTFSP